MFSCLSDEENEFFKEKILETSEIIEKHLTKEDTEKLKLIYDKLSTVTLLDLIREVI